MNDEVKPEDLKARTKKFALRIIRLCSSLDQSGPSGVISRQLVRSGTSVGAQYREAHRARSTAEFVSKLESAIQELDETTYWLELLVESELVGSTKLRDLLREADELMRILVASVRTAKSRSGR
jgi:four helix bundle protein